MKSDLYVRKSKIEGNGVFTKKPFKRGDIIFIFKGQKHNFFVKNKNDSAVGPNWIGLNKNLWLDVQDTLAKNVNHSCDPNMGIKGSVTCVALRDIKKDEEITFDYSITEEDVYWTMKCGCGSKNCRKVIHSIQSLEKNTVDKYLPFIPTYFQKVYRRCLSKTK